MNLSLDDKKIISERILDMEGSIVDNDLVRDSHLDNLDLAKNVDKTYKNIWFESHRYISQYEKEIESLIGEAISKPVKEQDLVDLANNSGRLYQGIISTAAKPISEFTGGGISKKIITPNEKLALSPELDEIANVLVNGKDDFSFPSVLLALGYSPGAGTLTTSGELLGNHWYLVGYDAILHISSVIHNPYQSATPGYCQGASGEDQATCEGNGGTWIPPQPAVPESWVGTISEVYEDGSAPTGGAVSSWGGYNNSERLSKVASSTTQRLMGALLNKFANNVNPWHTALKKTYTSVINNNAPNMDEDDKGVTCTDYAYLTTYIETYPIHDGPTGIDGLVSRIASRKIFIDPRVERIRDSKKVFYGLRFDFTNLRADIQSGTLTEVIFTSNLLSEFLPGGSDVQKRSLKLLKSLLN